MATPGDVSRAHEQERHNESSPGPGLHLSDLNPPSPAVGEFPRSMAPRRLDPISPARKKKKKTRKKRDKNGSVVREESVGEEATSTVQGGVESLMGALALNRLRARLDPMYNPPVPPLDLEEGEGDGLTPEDAPDRPVVSTEGTVGSLMREEPPLASEVRHKKGKKSSRRRDRDLRGEAEGALGEGIPPDRLPTTDLSEAGGELPESQVDGVAEGPSRLGTGRQLPAFPVDAEADMRPTVADQLAIAQRGGLVQTDGEPQSIPAGNEYSHPNDPQFLVSEEDIVEDPVEGSGGLHPLPLPTTTTHLPTTSQARSFIFVERKDGRGFITQRRGKDGGKERDVEGNTRPEREISSEEFALYAHKAIQNVAIAAHGFVAGISLWDCVVSNTLARQSNKHVDLLQHYNLLTLPVHAVYVFLLLIVMVSLFDRFDFAKLDRHCMEQFIRAPSHIILFIASILVFLGLVVTLSVAAIDERISLYPDQPSLWSDVLTSINTSTLASPQDIPSPTTHSHGSIVYLPEDDPTSDRVTSWLALVIVRAICCCGSWIMVVWISSYDRLEDYLYTMAGRRKSQEFELQS